MKKTKEDWKTSGKTPDYRFSLANERTFLAWIRTALAFLAGAIAIEQLLHISEYPWIKLALTLLLASAGGIIAIMASYRWKQNEIAMRHDKPLPYTPVLYLITLFIVISAIFSLFHILL
ncbi:TPA: YidH family protein [Providencia rettgeri]